MRQVPRLRVRAVNQGAVSNEGRFVLYWMIASRRTQWNFGLDRAAEWCRELGKPLVVLEALTATYPWANDRMHAFVIDGMSDNAERLEGSIATYYPYVEPQAGAGRGMLDALAKHASVIVTDDYPCFFLPALVTRTAARLAVRLEAVDSNGILPMAAATHAFTTAYSFRRFLQKELPNHWDARPRTDAVRALPSGPRAVIPREVLSRWPRTPPGALRQKSAWLAKLPIDHEVPASERTGGAVAARRTLRRFVQSRLAHYDTARNEPESEATSTLSPYLHFGHVSAHQILHAIVQQEGWSPDRVADHSDGSRAGWWGMSAASEAFLDQLITWRELGFNGCNLRTDYDRFESLPDWARATLEKHASDRRPFTYRIEQLDAAETHDELWNAAQVQLRREGTIHNYLRMLWGKQVLAWSPTPQEALEALIELNNKYALDGRDPNSYSGIFWCLGRYDRAWGPEREIFGTVRYMTSKNTARKYRVGAYLKRYAKDRISP